MNSLGLLAIARNEGHVLREFFDHYIWQGVDHFYIVDNNSTDNSAEIYKEYSSVLTLLEEPLVVNVNSLTEGNVQLHSYVRMLKEVTTDWIYLCDLDEFAYARRGFGTIKEFLNEHGHAFDQYLMRFKTFNSNGHIQQPESIVHGFTKRHTFPVTRNPMILPNKAIIRTNKMRSPGITHSRLIHPSTTVDSTLTYWVRDRELVPNDISFYIRNITEELYENSYIISNHYTVQSKEFYFNNKALRGRASMPLLIKGDPVDFYKGQWDSIEKRSSIDDFELSELTKLRKRS